VPGAEDARRGRSSVSALTIGPCSRSIVAHEDFPSLVTDLGARFGPSPRRLSASFLSAACFEHRRAVDATQSDYDCVHTLAATSLLTMT
jgi:hypothetical protein